MDNNLPEARSMTWDERMEFQQKGLDPMCWGPDEKKVTGQWERDMILFVMETMFPDVDYKKLPYSKLAKLAHKCVRITAKGDEEEKNS